MILMDKSEVHEALKPMKLIDSFKHKKGTTVIGSGFCVHKDYMKQGIAKKLQL